MTKDESRTRSIEGWMDPMVVATALSLYAYNVSPSTRANNLYDHFQGNCMEYDNIYEILVHRDAYAATALPYEIASVYIENALNMYGEEADRRCKINANALIQQSSLNQRGDGA
jgi:hypothetical protein